MENKQSMRYKLTELCQRRHETLLARRYQCGPNAKFKSPDGEMYPETTITCQWDKKWSREKLDPCKCNYLMKSTDILFLKYGPIFQLRSVQ